MIDPNAVDTCDECGHEITGHMALNEWGEFYICDECYEAHIECGDPVGCRRGGSMP
jgi:hypothetical protein